MLYLVLLPMHIVNFVTIGQQFSELYRLFKMINKPLLGWLLCSYHDNNLSNNVIIRSPNTKTTLTKNAFLSITGQDIPLLWQLPCSHHGYSPVSHLGLLTVHVVNFVTIGQQISELWRCLDLLIGGASPVGKSRVVILIVVFYTIFQREKDTCFMRTFFTRILYLLKMSCFSW